VVDDEETVRRSIQKRLEKEGYRVIAIDNALDGLKIFEGGAFDSVISDIRMREMNGLEFLGRIRTLDGDVPVIMITGDPSLETAQESVRRGAYDYITKPVEKEVLTQTVRRAVEKRRMVEQLRAHQRQLETRVREQTRVIRAILQMANRLNALESLEEVLSTVIQGVHRYTGSERVAVFLQRDDPFSLVFFRGTGVDERPLRKARIPLNSPFLLRILGGDDALRIRDAADPPPQTVVEAMGAFPWLGVGLVRQREPFGVILASERGAGGEFIEDELQILSYIGDSASVAVHNQLVVGRLRESYLRISEALAFAVEAKDPYTRGHSERVRRYAVELSRRLGLPEEEVLCIGNAAVLHDIGKVQVSRKILEKPDALTEEEFADMKEHPALGEIMVEGISFLGDARALIRSHHERWDGKGYPDGLRGEAIPVGARIIAVADTYDALTSQRPYREDTSRERAFLQLRREKGEHLDPALVEEFIGMIREAG
jgi:response regulator RpfG family c-di-GMP phosphodiesterase